MSTKPPLWNPGRRGVISDKAKKLERWVERYSELYTREAVVHYSALDTIAAIDCLLLMPEPDEEPSIEEIIRK